MKRWRLTPRAERSLTAIAIWTVEHFGPRQADIYRRQLIARINQLAAGEFPAGRPCGLLTSENPDANELRYSLVGRHYLIYREFDHELQVLDFVHGARDLESLLDELLSSGGNR